MITRRKAKMASNSDSVEFDVNNQLGTVNTEENTTPSEPSSVVESPEDRARGQTSKPEDVSLQMLMEFIRQQSEKQEERSKKQEENIKKLISEKFEKNNKLIIEKLDKQSKKQEENSRLIIEKLERNNRLISENLDKLDKSLDNYIEESMQSMNEQFTLLRTCLLYTSRCV